MTRYELLDRIGVGGMAEIFRGKAVAAGGFEKPVAIKRILPHLSQDKRFVELLIAEAKVLSLLKHRNIVQIFDVGLGDDGQYFLVMEYVDGKDLGAVQRGLEAKRRRLPLDLVLHIGAEICEALEHAHGARAPDGKPMTLVHRDVSPSNVLLSRAGEIKLTDFGIAKRAESEQTGTGAVRGKFAYISPEQARNEQLGPRSDVFSVAVLVWELITNQRLFSGLGDLESLRAVREAAVRRPSEADPRLTSELDALLMPALARDPGKRPTAGDLGAQLRTMRYSLEVTVGDPATELAKVIDTAEQVERLSQQRVATPPPAYGFDAPELTGAEHTVIRIRTADAFGARDPDGSSISAARQVIDRFEEEETRLAQLSGDQLRMLRSGRDSDLKTPPRERGRRPTEEPTTARPPLHEHFEADEATRLVAPTSRRTPVPERIKPRPATAPPPLPGMTGASGPGMASPDEDSVVPGTVHNRNPGAGPQPRLPPPQRPAMQPLPGAPPMHAPQGVPMGSAPMGPMGSAPMGPAPMGPAAPMGGMHGGPPNPAAPGTYPVWGGAQGPSVPDYYDRPPQGLTTRPGRQKRALQPWVLVVGALIMAAIAFAITRAFLG